MKRIVILLIFILFITGCSVSYQVEIDEDMKVTETAYITENDDFYKSFHKTTKVNALNSVYDIYKDYLHEFNYNSKVITEGPQVKIDRVYNSIEEYINSSLLFNDYFEEIKYDKKGDIVTIETVNFNKNDPDNPNRFNSEEIDVIIKPAFKVKDSNATKIDTRNNVYHFIYDNSMDDFKIFLELDTSSKFNPYMEIIMIIAVAIGAIIVSWIMVLILKKKKTT